MENQILISRISGASRLVAPLLKRSRVTNRLQPTTTVFEHTFFRMAANATNEVDNAMKKLLTNPGVTQYLICNADGIAIKYHNMDWKTAVQYCALVNDLVQKSKAAVEALLDPSENTVEYIRLHTGKNKEIIIAPAREYTLIAVQEPITAVDPAAEKKE